MYFVKIHTLYEIIHRTPLCDITVYNHTCCVDYTHWSRLYTVALNLEKITPGKGNLHRHRLWCLWQISGMSIDYHTIRWLDLSSVLACGCCVNTWIGVFHYLIQHCVGHKDMPFLPKCCQMLPKDDKKMSKVDKEIDKVPNLQATRLTMIRWKDIMKIWQD